MGEGRGKRNREREKEGAEKETDRVNNYEKYSQY